MVNEIKTLQMQLTAMNSSCKDVLIFKMFVQANRQVKMNRLNANKRMIARK